MKKNIYFLCFFLTIGFFANSKNLNVKMNAQKNMYKSKEITFNTKGFYKLYPIAYTNTCPGSNVTVVTTYYFTTQEAASTFQKKYPTISVTCP